MDMKYQTQTIIEVNRLIEKRNSLLPLKDEDERRLQKKYRLEFNFNSNHLEGNTLTYGQTELLLLFDKSTGDVKLSDLEEMKAHDVALTMIKDMAKEKERPLTEQFIKELNKIILVRPFWKEAITADGIETRKKIEIGSYKSSPNSVRLRNGEIHEYASPEETPAKMTDLMAWYQQNMEAMNPVQLAAEFHYRFVCIHPFDDGNGRVARLIMNYILLRFDYPLIIIKSKDKEAYLTALQKADTGNVIAIIEYIEKQMLWSLNLEIKAAKGDDLEEDDDIDKEIALLKREKLQNTIIHKSSDVVLELIEDFKNNIWSNIILSGKKFHEFFTNIETREYKIIPPIKDSTKVIDSFVNPSYDAVNSNREIIIPKNIISYNWEQRLVALKTTMNNFDIWIICTIQFRYSNYRIFINISKVSNSITLESKEIMDTFKKYDTSLTESEIKSIKKKISKYLLNEISLQK